MLYDPSKCEFKELARNNRVPVWKVKVKRNGWLILTDSEQGSITCSPKQALKIISCNLVSDYISGILYSLDHALEREEKLNTNYRELAQELKSVKNALEQESINSRVFKRGLLGVLVALSYAYQNRAKSRSPAAKELRKAIMSNLSLNLPRETINALCAMDRDILAGLPPEIWQKEVGNSPFTMTDRVVITEREGK